MARIAGVDIPRNKRIEISRTYIHGLGRKSSQKILDQLSINRDMRTQDLNDDQINAIRKLIDTNHTVEGDLRRLVHRKGLPARGQRTKTNARTRKGPKKTVANKKK